MPIKRFLLALFFAASAWGQIGSFPPSSSSAGASPTGCPGAGSVQLYATSTTFGCDSKLIWDSSGSGSLTVNTLSFQGYGAVVSTNKDFTVYLGPDDGTLNQVDFGTFVPPGATDKAAIGITEIAKADHITAYFDSQITWGTTDSTDATMILPYTIGMEGHCTSTTNCASLANYNFFLINSITGETLLQNTSAVPHQLSVPATTVFATLGTFLATGGFFSTNAVYTAAAPTTAAAQVSFGSTVAASSNCGSLATSAGCLVINVAGTTRYVPYY